MYLAKVKPYTPAQMFRIVLVALIMVGAFGFSPADTYRVAPPAIAPASSSLAQATTASLTASNPVALAAVSSPTYSASALALPKGEETNQPTSQHQSYQVSQPQDYPQGLYQSYLAARQSEGGPQYEAQPAAAGDLTITTTNPAQQLTTRFTDKGVNIEGLQLELSRVSYAGAGESAPALELGQGVAPVAEGNRVAYQSAPSLSQWYLNGPLGLEQGFTLAQPLTGNPSQGQTLEFELRLSGLKEAHLSPKADRVQLSLIQGRQLDYGQLYVYDASGKALPTHLELTTLGEGEGEYRLTIVVEELSGVSYPLTVDPLFVQSQLLSDTTSGGTGDQLGWSVALSGDGNTALIGAPGKTIGGNTSQGAAYIFTRSGMGSPYTQSQILSDTISGATYDKFGTSVALSSDGNTAFIGAYRTTIGGNTIQGAAYIFTRSGVDSNFFQSQILSDTISGTASDGLGWSVALSSDGNTALIGAVGKTISGNIYQGVAYIFTRSAPGSSYAQSQILSDTTSGASSDFFGFSVALSSDGNTALIGVYNKTIGANSAQGAAYIFTRSGVGSPYAQSQILSDTTSGAANDWFGSSVALSSDGNTALIGAPQKTIGGNTYQGAAYIFTRSGVGSPYAQSQVTTSGGAYDFFGNSVGLSSDGNIAFIGAYYKTISGHGQQGAAYIFTRSAVGSPYTQSQILSDTTSGGTGDGFGFSVALSSDGNTTLIGAYDKKINGNSIQGAAYSFLLLQSSSVSLNVSASALPFGQSLNITATVTPITATGTLTFHFDNTTLVTQTLASGSASYVTSTLAVGQHTIIATYSGDSNLPGSSSATVTVTVTPGPPSAITAMSGSGQSSVVNTTFGAPLVAKVTDAGNNPLSSQTVTFTAPASGSNGTFVGGSATYTGTTDASGTVTTSAFTANAIVGTYAVTGSVAGVATPASFQLTNLVACDPLQVTSSLDDSSCGTLRQAVLAASSPTKTITINLAAGSVITLSTGLTLTSGVAITTTAGCSSGPLITLLGSGVNSGDGLVLSSNNSLYGLWIRGFSARPIVAPTGSHTIMKCVRATKS